VQNKMYNLKEYKTGILVIIFIIILLSIDNALSDVTTSGASTTNSQTSTGTGGNTTISGGYSAETTNNYSGGQTNTTSNSTVNNSNQETAVASAIAPSMSLYSNDSCMIPISSAVTILSLSFSTGGYVVEDESCRRLKLARELSKNGLKLASISLLCQDEDVFEALYVSGLPCPIIHEGKSLIGAEAMKVIIERRKPTNDKVEQYRRYKESLAK
tara:strand:- start:1116 stop:1757 length:642 start_codon:yes stop_codon:yes gene_type:complete